LLASSEIDDFSTFIFSAAIYSPARSSVAFSIAANFPMNTAHRYHHITLLNIFDELLLILSVFSAEA
jgi:hypothetical protein